MIRALQLRRQRAIGSDEFEPAVDTGHGAHGHEAAASGLRQAIDQRRAFAVGFAQRIAGRAVEDEHLRAFGGAGLDGAAVETDVVGVRDLLAELGDASVDRQAARANPFFDRAARTQTPLGEVFLEPLGLAGRRRTRTSHELFLAFRFRRTAAPPRGRRRNRRARRVLRRRRRRPRMHRGRDRLHLR